MTSLITLYTTLPYPKIKVKNKVPKLTFTVSHENDLRLRQKNRHKGDISCTINDALDLFFETAEQRQ